MKNEIQNKISIWFGHRYRCIDINVNTDICTDVSKYRYRWRNKDRCQVYKCYRYVELYTNIDMIAST